jgi:hypothetical protein
VRDGGRDSGIRETVLAADFFARDSLAGLASGEGIGGAGVGVRGGVLEVSGGNLVFKFELPDFPIFQTSDSFAPSGLWSH